MHGRSAAARSILTRGAGAGSPALLASVLADNGLKLAAQIDSWANGAYKVPTISDVVTIFER